MIRIRSFFIILCIVVSTFICGILAIIVALFSSQGNMAHLVGRVWGRSLLVVARIKVTVKGFSNIDPSRSYIFMSNHQSNFDIPVLLAFLKVQFRWLAKAELFKIPIFGRGMRGAGYISIDRSNRRSAIESLKEAARTISNGASVLIFPEGTRSHDGNISPFKKGGFVLAVDAGVPLVPIVIHGTWDIMPRNRLLIKPGNVVLEIKEPVDTLDYTRKTKDDLLEQVRNIICESFEKGKRGGSRC